MGNNYVFLERCPKCHKNKSIMMWTKKSMYPRRYTEIKFKCLCGHKFKIKYRG